MPICPACGEFKPRLLNVATHGVNAVCQDCTTEAEVAFATDENHIDLVREQLLTVLRDNRDLPVRTIVDFEMQVALDDENLGARLVYADWLEENACPTRAKQLRDSVLAVTSPARRLTLALLHDLSSADASSADIEAVAAELAKLPRKDVIASAVDFGVRPTPRSKGAAIEALIEKALRRRGAAAAAAAATPDDGAEQQDEDPQHPGGERCYDQHCLDCSAHDRAIETGGGWIEF